ncbi:MAG TPA: hypothetical protein VK206_28180 [Anaerolineales bacterium]|nr:hypothetical protein [Anaerolineales bacterium]
MSYTNLTEIPYLIRLHMRLRAVQVFVTPFVDGNPREAGRYPFCHDPV